MMAKRIETITEHSKSHRGTYMINLFGSIIPIIMFLVYASTQINGLATEVEVGSLIAIHSSGLHPASEEAIKGVQEQLNSIQSFQIEERIEKQLKIVCQNPQLRDAIEPTVKQLIRDYNKVTKIPYTRPPCIQLGVS